MKTHLLSLLLTAGAAVAQTTGVPGMNDLTVNWAGSGSTSCTSMCFPGGNVTLNLDVSAPPGATAFLLLSFCPCTTCSLPGPANGCFPTIPATACGGSNQSLDLDMSPPCGIVAVVPVAVNSAGTLGTQVPIPPLAGPPCTTALAIQAVVIDPCGAGVFAMPGPFVLTQAYTLWF
ncbi:MAG: hypothetical protein JNL12_01185 [Planctomycetes bacterium]|nr:hypothetical protein [Planctomycetota bacterium]